MPLSCSLFLFNLSGAYSSSHRTSGVFLISSFGIPDECTKERVMPLPLEVGSKPVHDLPRAEVLRPQKDRARPGNGISTCDPSLLGRRYQRPRLLRPERAEPKPSPCPRPLWRRERTSTRLAVGGCEASAQSSGA